MPFDIGDKIYNKKASVYLLRNFENERDFNVLKFITKAKNESGELETIADGTTNEEVILCLIDRISVLNKKHPCVENEKAVLALKEAFNCLNLRTKDREKRSVEGKDED